MNERGCQLQRSGPVRLALACVAGLWVASWSLSAARADEPAASAAAAEPESVAPAEPGSAAPTVPVRLADLEVRARSARPFRAGADAQLEEARARIQVARAAYAPTLNLVSEAYVTPGQRIVDIEGYKVSAAFPIGQSGAFRPAARYGVTLDLHGNLYDFGRTSAAVDAAEAQERAQRADVLSSERQTTRDVRAGYVRWATAYALWKIAQDSEQAAVDRLARTRGAIEEGARPPADLNAAESGAGFARIELERAYAELESARDDLGYVAATDLDAAAVPADDVLNTPPSEAAASDAMLEARLRALQQQRVAAQAAARVHDHAFHPVLSANAQAGMQGLNGNVFPLYRVGINLAMPLWDGGAEAANRAQAEARAAQLGAQAQELERGKAHARKRSLHEQQQAQRRIDVAQQLVAVCRTRVSQLEAAWPLRSASYAELAEARRELSRAQTELVMAQALRAQAQLGLD